MEKKTCFTESVDDLPRLPENTCDLSLANGLKMSLKACCKNGCAKPLTGEMNLNFVLSPFPDSV